MHPLAQYAVEKIASGLGPTILKERAGGAGNVVKQARQFTIWSISGT